MNKFNTDPQQSKRGFEVTSALLFLSAYAASIYALMLIFIVVLGFGDPKFRAPDIYFAIHALFFAPAALFASAVVATRSSDQERLRFGGAAVVAIVVCDLITLIIDHWLVLIPLYVALLGLYLYRRYASRLTKVA